VETATIDDLEPRDVNSAMARSPVMSGDNETLHIPVGVSLADAERSIIFATLRHCGGNKTRAAALLGVSLKTLYNRLNAYRAHGLEEAELPATN
jgi:DNA-binding NtrC family response regulator